MEMNLSDSEIQTSIEESARALREAEQKFGPNHLVVAEKLENHARLLRQVKIQLLTAVNMEARAKCILQKHPTGQGALSLSKAGSKIRSSDGGRKHLNSERKFIVAILASLCLVTMVITWLNGNLGSSLHPAIKNELLAFSMKVGDPVRIRTETILCIDQETLNEAIRAASIQDMLGLQRLVIEQRAFPVSSNTKVLIVESGMGVKKVRIQEGPGAGEAGWILNEQLN